MSIDQRLEAIRRRERQQRSREAALIAADRADERVEQLRIEAEQAALNGHVTKLQDTVVQPTPEWLAKGAVTTFTPRGRDGTVKSVVTVRRRIYNAVTHLEGRGVLDEQQALSCRWYQALYEEADTDRSAGIASYGENIHGFKLYGHLPLSERIARARTDLRGLHAVLPVGCEVVLKSVVINNLPLERAARVVGVHRRKVQQRLKTAADVIATVRSLRDRANENAR
jgi:hypothetical protein